MYHQGEIMSDVHDSGTTVPANENADDTGVVSKQAYKQVSQDMHTYKSKMKQLQAEMEALKADKEAREKSVLEEQEKWHDLYKKSESKIGELLKERDHERVKFVEGHKKNSVLQQISFKKQDYIKFVDVSKIEVNEDGSINPDTVSLEVERIKKEYPELLKSSAKEPLPDAAPRGAKPKSLQDMTPSELAEARRAALQKK